MALILKDMPHNSACNFADDIVIATHCGLKNILVFLSPTPKTNGGHENRAKSVWESSFIEILDLPPWP